MRILRPIPPLPQLRLLVFDMDGTLVDSRLDLVHSVNAMMRHFGRHELPGDLIASYIGDGALTLVRRALGDPDDEVFVHSAHDFFLDYYRAHKLDNTHLYPGVISALSAIREASRESLTMAILTNKPVRPSLDIASALGLSPFMFQNYGGNSFHSKKPDPHGLLTLMQEAHARPEETVMVGDSEVDVLTAQNAGTWSVGCLFGLAPHTLETLPPDVLVDAAAEWPAALGAL